MLNLLGNKHGDDCNLIEVYMKAVNVDGANIEANRSPERVKDFARLML